MVSEGAFHLYQTKDSVYCAAETWLPVGKDEEKQHDLEGITSDLHLARKILLELQAELNFFTRTTPLKDHGFTRVMEEIQELHTEKEIDGS